MEVNAAVPRTSEAEGLTVVSSLSEVSHQIAIAEEIPTEHETSHPSVFPNNGQVSSEETVEHQHCEVQVVKVANVGGVNITFATPALANLARVGEQNEGQPTTIQVSDAQLAPIQEVAIAQSPDEGSNSEATNLQGEQVIHDIQDDQMQGSPLHIDSVSRGNSDVKSSWDAVMNAEVLTVRCRNESAELHKSKLGSGGRGKCIKVGFSSLCLVELCPPLKYLELARQLRAQLPNFTFDILLLANLSVCILISFLQSLLS